MPKLGTVADATAERTSEAARRVRDTLDEAAEARRAAVDEATSILDSIRESAGRVGEMVRSARTSAETVAETAAESVRETRGKARASAELARSKGDEIASIGDRALQAASAMGESARHAIEDAGASVDRARLVVGDAITGAAAERLRLPRTSRRARAGLLAGGLAGGAAATYFLDPDRGADRRRLAMDQIRTWSSRLRDALAAMARGLPGRIEALLAAAGTTMSGPATASRTSSTTRSSSRAAKTQPDIGSAEPMPRS